MSATNINDDYLNEEDLPIPIPPAKDGWADMERRLNATPPTLQVKRSSQLLLRAAMIAGMVAVVSAALAVAYHFLFHPHQESSLVPAIVAPDHRNHTANHNSTGSISTTDTLQQSSISQNNYQPPASATPATNGVQQPGAPRIDLKENSAADSVSGKGVLPAASATVAGNKGSHPATGTAATTTNAHTASTHRSRTAAATSHGNNANTAAASDPGRIASRNPRRKGHQKSPTTSAQNGDTQSGPHHTSPEKNNGDTESSQRSTSPEKNIPDGNTPSQAGNPASITHNTLQSLPLANHQLLTKQPPTAVAASWHSSHTRVLPEWQLFLQWQLPVPLTGSSYYFNGPNGSNQFYRTLIPGIRGMRTWNANSISLDLIPFTAQTYNSPVMNTATTMGRDSSNTRVTNTLQKEFGAGATLLYHRRILSHWQIAAGIQFNYWMQQSVNQKTVHYARWTGNPVDSSNTIQKESIHRPELKVPLEIYYNAPRWQAGVRIDVPVVSKRDSLTSDIKTPVQLQLMLRYKLLPRRKSSFR